MENANGNDFWLRYRALQKMIEEEGENIVFSEKFTEILNEIKELFTSATTQKQQLLEAQIFLDFVNKLSLSIKSFSKKEISPADFVTGLLQTYGEQTASKETRSLKWSELGEKVSGVFHDVFKCCSTMVGPMDVEPKKKKTVSVKRKRSIAEIEHPEDLNSAAGEENTETDKNIATMFQIMKKRKKAEKVQDVIMNKNSFAQTVENLFALSFLVKDGRAEMKVDSDGNHVVSLRNAPDSEVVKSGQVKYKHFVFRIDYKDWKTMKDHVVAGNEVMPHRNLDNLENGTHDG